MTMLGWGSQKPIRHEPANLPEPRSPGRLRCPSRLFQKSENARDAQQRRSNLPRLASLNRLPAEPKIIESRSQRSIRGAPNSIKNAGGMPNVWRNVWPELPMLGRGRDCD